MHHDPLILNLFLNGPALPGARQPGAPGRSYVVLKNGRRVVLGMGTGSGTFAAPPLVAGAVADALLRDGERRVCAVLGLSRLTVAKLAGGLPVRLGTVAQARERLGLPRG